MAHCTLATVAPWENSSYLLNNNIVAHDHLQFQILRIWLSSSGFHRYHIHTQVMHINTWNQTFIHIKNINQCNLKNTSVRMVLSERSFVVPSGRGYGRRDFPIRCWVFCGALFRSSKKMKKYECRNTWSKKKNRKINNSKKKTMEGFWGHMKSLSIEGPEIIINRWALYLTWHST